MKITPYLAGYNFAGSFFFNDNLQFNNIVNEIGRDFFTQEFETLEKRLEVSVLFEVSLEEFRSEFNKEWPRTIMDSLLPYKKFHIINGFEMAKYVKSGEDLLQKNVYCGIFMAKAGK